MGNEPPKYLEELGQLLTDQIETFGKERGLDIRALISMELEGQEGERDRIRFCIGPFGGDIDRMRNWMVHNVRDIVEEVALDVFSETVAHLRRARQAKQN